MVRQRRIKNLEPAATPDLLAAVRSVSRPLRRPADLEPLINRIGDARFVLLGEASHGTHEYYTWRAVLSRRLIEEKGFSFIAVEGDWPDCYRVNRYVKGWPDAGDNAHDALHAFDRWPTWMWANEEMVQLAEWLHRHNRDRREEAKAGFYGLDVYSLWDSLYQVMNYLRKIGGEPLDAARRAFHCFEPHGEDARSYARATRFVPESCEREVIDLLKVVRAEVPTYASEGREAHFTAEQNALVVKNAETYYRSMIGGQAESWNVRDRHMVETLERLMAHHGQDAKAIVWEHNTHIGDARYTNMADDGMVNVGQLVRERREREGVVVVGFGSNRGTVIAADEWDAPMERMEVPPGRPGSWEDVLHRASPSDQLLLFGASRAEHELLRERGHRAIGVVYHPAREHRGNYVPTVLPRRYDAFVYIDETRALRPLHFRLMEREELPETYPTGM